MIETLSHQTPLGEIVLAAQEDALIGLWFRGQKYEFSTLKGEQAENPDSALLREAVRWVDAYFEGRRPDPRALSLRPLETPFREKVWEQLLNIPYGRNDDLWRAGARTQYTRRRTGRRRRGGT